MSGKYLNNRYLLLFAYLVVLPLRSSLTSFVQPTSLPLFTHTHTLHTLSLLLLPRSPLSALSSVSSASLASPASSAFSAFSAFSAPRFCPLACPRAIRE